MNSPEIDSKRERLPEPAALSMRDVLLVLTVSHHVPEQYDHCVMVPFGSRRLPVCGRCLGIYPLALVLLLLQITGRLDLAFTDPWLVLLLPLPAVVEFVGEQLGRWHGSNAARILTGLPLGIALSRMFVRYLLHPSDPLFWGIVAGYGGVCGLTAAFALRRRFGRGS